MRRPPSRRFTPSGHSRTRTRLRRSRHATRSSAVGGGRRRHSPSARLPSGAPRRRSPTSPTRWARRGPATPRARDPISALDDIERAEGAAGGAHAYWAGQVRIQRLAASGWLARTMGDTAEAVRLATTAADLEDGTQKHPVTPGSLLPARELLGDLLLELGRPVEAAQAYA